MALPVLAKPEKLQVDRNDFGRADSLSYNILTLVADERYDRALEQMREFVEKDSGYPVLRNRIERHMNHGMDIVSAIRTKRNFPGFKSLTASKQNELMEKTLYHFEELKMVLKKVERIQVDVKLEDIRSTVIVVRAIVMAAIAVVIVAFVREASRGLFSTLLDVVDDFFGMITDYVLSFLGL